MDINDLNSKYEKKHLANIARTNERIREVFSDAIHTLTLSAGRIRFNGEVFDLSKYPALKAQIEEVIKEMGGTIYTALVNSIEASWGLANEKNDILVDRRLAGKKPSPNASQILYDPNKAALDAFIKRKDKGLGLSDRVWKGLEPFKTELEKGLGLGIAEGKPAKAMATELKQFLNEPDKLFRRVRDAKGKLKLSKAAKAYHPGQGVYRSSVKNAQRLTRTETNMAYRNADVERWQKMEFITGYEIKLSNAHPRFDICDHLKGKYPKTFVWAGWHPHCLCHAVPLFASDEDYEKIEDRILGLNDKPVVIEQITHPPKAFHQFVKDNNERILGWSNRPYWYRDNPDFIGGALQSLPAGKPKPKAVEWAASMSQSDAKAFVSKSAVKEPHYHVTKSANMDSLMADGFDLNKKAFGRHWGDGVYLGTDRNTAAIYEQLSSQPVSRLEIYADVRNPLVIDLSKLDGTPNGPDYWDRYRAMMAKEQGKWWQAYNDKKDELNKVFLEWSRARPSRGKLVVDMTESEKKAYFEWLGKEPMNGEELNALAMSEAAKAMGYDAIQVKVKEVERQIGGNQLVVFDPKKVVIVKR